MSIDEKCRHRFGNMASYPRQCFGCGGMEDEINTQRMTQTLRGAFEKAEAAKIPGQPVECAPEHVPDLYKAGYEAGKEAGRIEHQPGVDLVKRHREKLGVSDAVENPWNMFYQLSYHSGLTTRDIFTFGFEAAYLNAPMRESVTQQSPVYKALWALRHMLQVRLFTPQGEELQLFHDDDYHTFAHAGTNWKRKALAALQDCIVQADHALTEIEGGN